MATAITKTLHLLPCLQRMAFSRGASMLFLHHLATSRLSPTLTWGSEVWWTGAQHILDNLGPTYNRFARLITALPSFTRTDKLLCAASIPPLNLLLDLKSQLFGIRLLLSPDSHPNKISLQSATPLKVVGIGRIRALLEQLIPPGADLENPSQPLHFMDLRNLHIPTGDKEPTALAFKS